MARRLLIVLLVFAACKPWVTHSRAIPPSAADALLRSYVQQVNAGNYAGAAKLFHYPPSETGEQRLRDVSVVTASIRILDEEFGHVASYGPQTAPFRVRNVGIGGGDLPYWQHHPEAIQRVYRATFTGGDGTIEVLVCNLSGRPELRAVKYGLPVQSQKGVEKVAHATKEIFKLVLE